MIRILIAEDSKVTAMLLQAVFDAAPDMQVIGVAGDGLKAVKMAQNMKPDIVAMDIHMPVLDGLEATRRIMNSNPMPIILISVSLESKDLKITFKAVEAGALAVMEKPEGFEDSNFKGDCRDLVNMIRVMSSVTVQRRKDHRNAATRQVDAIPEPVQTKRPTDAHCDLVAIGSSLGGPQALQSILAGLPADFPVPVVITQHISTGFLQGLVDWLNIDSPVHIKQAQANELLLAGHVYLAPDGVHLKVRSTADELRVWLGDEEPEHGFRPSASVMLKSVATVCPGKAVGIILSGIGRDGASGLLNMRQAGCTTLVQDKASAVIYGMPGAALELDAVAHVVRVEKMTDRLIEIASKRKPAGTRSGRQSIRE